MSILDRIFADLAPKYQAAGINVIPLRQAQKIPIPGGWQAYSGTMVPESTMAHWIDRYPTANIGVVLGEASNLCIVDIDTEDKNLEAVILGLLMPSPWARRGRKGVALAYRYSGFKTFRIKDSAGNMIVEVLSTGSQCVLPGSIHPDTKKPYLSDTDLWDEDVLAALCVLPPGVEAIWRSALEAQGCSLSLSGHTRVTDYVSSGARDVTMISVAGVWARGVLRGELPFKVAVDELRAWGSTRMEVVAGDEVDIEKGVLRLADFLIRDVTGPKKRPLPDGWDAGLTAVERVGYGFGVFTDLNVAWDYDKLKAYVRAEWILHEPDTKGRRDAVDFILARLVFSGIDPKDEAAILRYIAMTAECGYKETTLRKSLNALRYSGINGDNQTEIAKQLIEDKEQSGAFVFVAGAFWQWTGSHWEAQLREALQREIALEFGHLPAAKRAGDHRGIIETMSVMLAKETLSETTETGVNFANGFLTDDLILRPHDAMYGCTYTLPYRYMIENGAGCPRFLALLEQSWGEDEDYLEKVLCFQECLAITMFNKSCDYARVFLLHGPPKSGKSQLLSIIESLVPESVLAGLGPEHWGDKFLPAQLFGKLINIAGELSEKRKIDGARFKSIVTGDAMTGQHKNGQPFKFRVECAHWFASNHIPRTDDTSGGFTRRWIILTYNKTVESAKLVLGLGKLIAIDEREAIVSWAVPALRRAMSQRGITVPPSSEDRMAEVARMNNSLRVFLLDSGKVLMGAFAASTQTPIREDIIYNAYTTFAFAAGGAQPVSIDGFRQQMRELGSEMGFQIRSLKSGQGKVDYAYERITLVANGVVQLRALSGTGSPPT